VPLIKLEPLQFTRGAITTTARSPLDAVKAIRSAATRTLTRHAEGEPGRCFRDDAADDFANMVAALADLRLAKAAHARSVAAVDNVLAALADEPVEPDLLQHPLVALALELRREASLAEGFAAGDLSEVADTFAELRDLLADVGKTLQSQHSKAVPLVRAAAGAALADVRDLETAHRRMEALGEDDLEEILPPRWSAKIEDFGELSTATMDPAAAIGSPERQASVLHWQLCRCRSDERKVKRAQERKQQRTATERAERETLAELKALVGGDAQ